MDFQILKKYNYDYLISLRLSWGIIYISSLTKQENLETPALAPDEGVSKFACRASPVKTTYHG